jgi:hypothetical protein
MLSRVVLLERIIHIHILLRQRDDALQFTVTIEMCHDLRVVSISSLFLKNFSATRVHGLCLPQMCSLICLVHI